MRCCTCPGLSMTSWPCHTHRNVRQLLPFLQLRILISSLYHHMHVIVRAGNALGVPGHALWRTLQWFRHVTTWKLCLLRLQNQSQCVWCTRYHSTQVTRISMLLWELVMPWVYLAMPCDTPGTDSDFLQLYARLLHNKSVYLISVQGITVPRSLTSLETSVGPSCSCASKTGT